MKTRSAAGRATTDLVLRAAGSLFFTRGYTETTVRDIAASAGVSVGRVMSVGDKDSLLVATFDDRIRTIHLERSASTVSSSSDPIADVYGLFAPFVDLFTEHPIASRRYASILVAGRHRSAVFTELADMIVDEIAAALSHHRDAIGGSVAVPPATLARTVYFAYLGLLFTWNPEDDDRPEALESALRGLVSTFLPDWPNTEGNSHGTSANTRLAGSAPRSGAAR